MSRRDRFESEPPPGSERRGRLEGVIPDLIKKTVQVGFDRTVGPLLDAPMPAVDESALVRDEIELVLQVSGKTRGAIRVPASADKAAIEAAATAAPEVAKFGEGKAVRKVIVVPGRLVNVVVG